MSSITPMSTTTQRDQSFYLLQNCYTFTTFCAFYKLYTLSTAPSLIFLADVYSSPSVAVVALSSFVVVVAECVVVFVESI